METYRVTYVNPSFAPRASILIVRAGCVAGAIERFREQVNQTNVIQTIGNRGVVRVERLKGGAA